jgi:hypothetical protein
VSWEPLVAFGDWGHLQIVINDTDVTFFREVPAQVLNWSSGDPFGDAVAVIRFPQVSPFEPEGVGALSWLKGHANVDINLVRAGGEVVPLWEGMIASIEDDLTEDTAGVSLQCIGALYQLDYYVRPDRHLSEEKARTFETAIAEEFYPLNPLRGALRLGALQIEYPAGMTESGLETRYSGAWEKVGTGYIQRLLADMVHNPEIETGQPEDPKAWDGAWTLMKLPGRIPVLRVRNEEEVDWRVSVGAPGVTHSLKSDYSQTPNVIYGEGTDESATTWRNSTVEVFEDGETETNHYPIAWWEAVWPARKGVSEAGEPTDPWPNAYSHDNVRVEIVQKYGPGVTLLQARSSANQQLLREVDPGWFGTITLKTDPAEGSRFEIQAGHTIRLRHFRGIIPTRKEIYAELRNLNIFLEGTEDYPEVDRGQFASVVVRTLELSGYTLSSGSGYFSDTGGNFHEDNINKLAAEGIVIGYDDGTYRPADSISRAEMAAIITRAAEWATDEELTALYNHFNDYLDTNSLRTNVNKAIENDLVRLYPNNAFYPSREASRYESGESIFLLMRFIGNGILEDETGVFLHIAQTESNLEAGTVTLTVDSKFRDLTTLAQLIERTKAENQNPAKMLMVNRESARTDDTKFPWDYWAGSGSLPQKAMTPRAGALPVMPPSGEPFSDYFVYVNGANGDPWRRWTIVPVVAAGKGSVSRTEIRAYTGGGAPLATPFHVGVYSMYITAYSMPQDPFVEGAFKQPSESGSALSGYDPSAIVLWGQFEQRAGYWPGLESEGDPVTGVLIDEGTWQFQLPEGENVFWVAIYAPVNCWFQGRFYHGVQ